MIPTLHSIPAPTSSPVARIGGGGFSLAPAVNLFGAVAGSSSPMADETHGTGFVAGPTLQTPGADGANRVNAGGIQ